ncbi:hypothetical protein [Paraoerskovia sediminicola]|uniref:hypothetical protein n=1 Tax=Paraoerskovia sediminicola TaxID=1138587 RepID=UPI00257379A3|nr:hypothetical protein [Paraoerskovia sediminicola]
MRPALPLARVPAPGRARVILALVATLSLTVLAGCGTTSGTPTTPATPDPGTPTSTPIPVEPPATEALAVGEVGLAVEAIGAAGTPSVAVAEGAPHSQVATVGGASVVTLTPRRPPARRSSATPTGRSRSWATREPWSAASTSRRPDTTSRSNPPR